MTDAPEHITEEQYEGLLIWADLFMDEPTSAEELLLRYAVCLIEAYEEEHFPIEDDDSPAP